MYYYIYFNSNCNIKIMISLNSRTVNEADRYSSRQPIIRACLACAWNFETEGHIHRFPLLNTCAFYAASSFTIVPTPL